MEIRSARSADADAINELLDQLGYPHAAGHGCIRMEVTSGDQRSDAHDFYKGRGYVDQAGRSTRFLRELPAQV